jgi:hypothetical protein
MGAISPRTTAENQTLEDLPIDTSPTTVAVSAMKTVGSIFFRDGREGDDI